MAKWLLTAEAIVFLVLLAILVEAIRARSKAVVAFVVAIVLVIAALILTVSHANARDLGQWQATDPEIRNWYQTLMQPDLPNTSCCGEADAYWADSFEVDGDRYVAIITDPRDDALLGRKHVDIGTRIVVPNHKLKYDRSNPTGHGVIFLSRENFVFCYVAPGGV